MESASQAIFEDWSPPILLTGILILVALIYLRGWFEIRKTRPSQFSTMAPPVVPPWHRRHLAGDSVSSRRVRRCAAQCPHGGAPAADVVCSAFAAHRMARRSHASWSAAWIHQIYRRTAHSPQKAAATGPLASQAARGLARYESYFLGLAHTGSLRLRPGTRTLA